MRQILAIATLLVAWLAADAAQAQDPPAPEPTSSIDTERFRPSTARASGVFLEGTSPGEPWEIDAVLWLHGSGSPVVLTVDGERTDAVVKGRLGGYLGAGFNLGPRVRLALGLPLTLVQSGTDPVSGTPLATGGVGDLRVVPSVMILDPTRKWLGLSLSAPVTFPTGREDALLGEAAPTVEPQVHLEKRLVFTERHRWLNFSVGLEAGWRVRPRTQLLDLDTGGEFTIAAGGRWEPSERLAVGTELAAALGTGTNGRSAEWVSWARLTPDAKRRFDVVGGLAVGLGQGIGTPQARVFAGVRVRLDPRPRATVAEAEPFDPEPIAALDPGPQPPVPGEAGDAWGLRLVGRRADLAAEVLFEFDSHRLTDDGRRLLADVAGWLTRHGATGRVEVGGHCDVRGTSAYNADLSRRRAEAVVDALVGHGVPRERLVAEGYGESRPAGADHDANRRVEFVFLGPIRY